MPQRHGFHGRFVGGGRGGGSGGAGGGGKSLKAQQKAQNKALSDARKAQAKATKQINGRGPKPPSPIRSSKRTKAKVKVNPKTLGVKTSVRSGVPRRKSSGLVKGAIRVARKVG